MNIFYVIDDFHIDYISMPYIQCNIYYIFHYEIENISDYYFSFLEKNYFSFDINNHVLI